MSIEEIRGRLDAATPGPWSWTPNAFGNPSNGPDHHVIRSEDTRDQRAQFPVAQTDYDEMGSHDAEFIAHAPEDMRRLLAAVEAVEGWMQNLDAVERAKPTDPNDLNCSARDVARNVRAAIRAALEAS